MGEKDPPTSVGRKVKTMTRSTMRNMSPPTRKDGTIGASTPTMKHGGESADASTLMLAGDAAIR